MSETAQLTSIKDLPSPKGKIILGNLPEFKTENKHLVLEEWAKECGDLYKISLAGKIFVVSAKPDLNAEILKLRPKEFRRFGKIDEIFTELGITGVFNAEGERWKRHRKITSEALNAQNVKSFYPTILEKTDILLSKFSTYAEAKEKVAVQSEMMAYTVDITTKIAFGYQMNSIENVADNFQEHLERIFPMINQRITAPLPLWRIVKSKESKALDHSLSEIKKLIYTFIDEAKSRLDNSESLKANPSNFLEAILVESERETFSKEEIYGNVFTMLLAGEDTTSNSISWAIYYLAQHPEIVKRIRDEAKEVYGDTDLPQEYSSFAKLKFSNAVAQEAIRIKPTTPQLYMQANEDVIVGQLSVPKATIVVLQSKIAQNSDDYFTNALTFNPDRWMRGKCPVDHKHSPKVVKAFGGGPRYCPGMNLAMHEMTVLISALCKRFDFELAVKAEDVKDKFAFTMHPDNLWVKFKIA
ncbi:MAG: hypothetical protein BM555_02745 [Crocinitomix sp. MedPE-SWsnd]|nr:MAG: hypothetical protein BM555_02745 [Crocinitomix sp. MedPE-SWsnd]